jgi:hypothetical protein
VNEAILLALPMNPFLQDLLCGREPAGYAFQKALYIVSLSILCISQSSIIHHPSGIRHQASGIRH